MGQVRVSVERFVDIERLLNRARAGDEVLIEEGGAVVARVTLEPRAIDWEKFFALRADQAPLDNDFERHVLEMIAERNKPAEDIDWEF